MEFSSFYVGIIWYCFTGAFGINLYRWKWLGIKSVFLEEWSFYKTPDQLIKGITLECAYLDGNVKLCCEHKGYFWATVDSVGSLSFNRNFLQYFKSA